MSPGGMTASPRHFYCNKVYRPLATRKMRHESEMDRFKLSDREKERRLNAVKSRLTVTPETPLKKAKRALRKPAPQVLWAVAAALTLTVAGLVLLLR